MSNEKAYITSIGSRVSACRECENQTQEEFASILGVSRGYLGDIERDRSKPSTKFLTLLTSKYGVSADWILTGEGDPYRLSPETKWNRCNPDGSRYYWDEREKKDFAERVELIQKYKKLSFSEYLEKINCTKSELMESFHTCVPCVKTIHKIELAFPDISMDWLVTGEGSMLKNDDGMDKIILMYQKSNDLQRLDMLRAVEKIYAFKQMQDELDFMREQNAYKSPMAKFAYENL